jgi:hypothetical protein
VPKKEEEGEGEGEEEEKESRERRWKKEEEEKRRKTKTRKEGNIYLLCSQVVTQWKKNGRTSLRHASLITFAKGMDRDSGRQPAGRE